MEHIKAKAQYLSGKQAKETSNIKQNSLVSYIFTSLSFQTNPENLDMLVLTSAACINQKSIKTKKAS